MKFLEVVNRLTGISTPVFGLQWTPSEMEISKARRILVFLEDRRVLYNPGKLEVPEQCVDSVVKIREFLTTELGTITTESEVGESLRAMRASCRKFLDTVGGRDSDIVINSRSHGHWTSWRFYPALGELRGVFGVHVALLAVKFGLDLEENLQSIIPISEGRLVTHEDSPREVDWIKVSSAAKLRGISRQAMYYHVDNNSIRTMELDGVTYVDKEAVLNMRTVRTDAGKPNPDRGPGKRGE